MSDSCDPIDNSTPVSSDHGIFQARVLEWLAFPSLGNIPHPEIKPQSPALQEGSLPSEPPGKPIIYNKAIYQYFLKDNQNSHSLASFIKIHQ